MTEKGIKYRARVVKIDDPKGLGRIRAQIVGFEGKTPWCWPDAPLAGPGFGMYFLPTVGDVVHLEQTADGDWIWTGCCWTSQNSKPAAGTSAVRVIRTPAGHQVKLDDEGDVEISAENGSRVTLKADGTIEVYGDHVNLNGSTAKVVTTAHICAFTGGPHIQGSATVKADGGR